MKLEVVLKPCPWCRKTPDIFMPIVEDTWCWEIQCNNQDCWMKPKTRHVAIRKTTKKEFIAFHAKIDRLAHIWNGGNPMKAYEMKVIDLEEIPELNKSAEYLCLRDHYYTKIVAI